MVTIHPQNKGPVSRKGDHNTLSCLLSQKTIHGDVSVGTTDGRSATSLATWCCRHNLIRTRWLPTLSVDNKHTCEKWENQEKAALLSSSYGEEEERAAADPPKNMQSGRERLLYVQKSVGHHRGTWCSHLTFLFECLCVSSTAHIQAAQRKGLFQQRKQSRVFKQKKGSKYTCNFNKWNLTMLIMFYHRHHLLLIKTEIGKGKKKYGIWHSIN